jgi:hypothetical protein
LDKIASHVALVANVIGIADAVGAVSNTEFMLLSVFNGTEGNRTGQGTPAGRGWSSRTLQASRAFYNGLPCRASVNDANLVD